MFSIFFIVFFALAIGIVTAILVTRNPLPDGVQLVPPEQDFDQDDKAVRRLTLEDLFKLGQELCKANGLTIKERLHQSAGEVYWVCESKNEFFFGNYVLAFVEPGAENPFVTMHDVLEFKDFIKSWGSSKGFFFTTGYFTRDVHQPLEGPSVTLYNRRKVLADLKSHGLSV